MSEMPKMQQMREAQQQMRDAQQKMREDQHRMREEQQKMRDMQRQMREEMPSPLGLRERRAQRQKLVADVIAQNTIRSQSELQELLQERGVLATQSSVSRDLRDLGVRRVKGVYVIKPSRGEGGWSFDDVIELVELVTRSGFNLTVIQTVPNAARLVAHTLQEAGWDEVVGTVADDDTIFVATRTEEDQDRLFQRFKQYLNV
jgi:transcriptional regulator of arginine metabolism